jgi:hypothetical protein
MEDIMRRLPKYAVICCPKQWPKTPTATPSASHKARHFNIQALNLDVSIPDEFFTIPICKEAVEAFLSCASKVKAAQNWDEETMTRAHEPMYDACIGGLASLVPTTDRALTLIEH